MKHPIAITLCIFFTFATHAGESRNHDISPDDYFTLANIVDVTMSRDGSMVAFVDMRWQDGEDSRNLDIWVAPTVGDGAARRLTFDTAPDMSPVFSPDGEWVYFQSSIKRAGETKPPYDGKGQVWRIPTKGGTAMPVTQSPANVQAFALAPDGNSLFYATESRHMPHDPFTPLQRDFDRLTYGHGVVKATRIERLNLVTWRTETVVEPDRVIYEFDVAPDGKRLAMLTMPTNELMTREGWSNVEILDLNTRKTVIVPDELFRAKAPSPYGWLLMPRWSPDGRDLAFHVGFDGYPPMIVVARVDGDKISTKSLPRPGEVHPEGALEWRPGSHEVCWTADDHARSRVVCVDADSGKGRSLTKGDVVVELFAFSENSDAMVVSMGTVSHFPDLFMTDTRGGRAAYRRLTDINPHTAHWKLPTVKVVSWTSSDGTKIEGILELPPGYENGKLPMAVELHGGPTDATRLNLRYWIYGRTLLAARGWALLSPNYRGSTGFGDKFMTDLIGHKNERDVADILSGVDAMVAQGIADPDRLAVMGWSNGGYLANCVISTTDRFKAASSGAGVIDTAMQWMIEDTPGHVINYHKGNFPWTNADLMRKTSPLYKAKNIHTPTLLHVGENDERVPPQHSKGLFRALHHYLKVPSHLVMYPGEGHGLTRRGSRMAKMKWDLAWLEYYVLGKKAPDGSTLPDNAGRDKKDQKD